MSRGRIVLAALTAVLALGILAWYAPSIHADRFREPLRQSLEAALHRKVEFQDVRYQLFPSPGLSARNVVIQDDGEFGLDALAYVDDLQVTLRWWSLISGRMDVASARMVDCSVNLVRHTDGRWNIQPLLREVGSGTSVPLPELIIRNGRINFRLGEVKSSFYMTAVDLDLSARGTADGGVDWQYEASPARTDRAEQGFGRFSGSGRWRPDANHPGGSLDIELALARSAIAEVSMLVFSRDLGLQGRVSSRARLFGPVNRVQLNGTLQFDDVENTGILSAFRTPRWAVPYEGLISLTGESVDLLAGRSPDPTGSPLPVSLHLQAARLFGNTTGQALFQMEELPAEAFVEVARRFGARIPEGLALKGMLTGGVTVTSERSVKGEIQLRNATAQLQNSEAMEVSDARLSITDDQVQLESVRVQTESGGSAEVSGRWSTTSAQFQFRVLGTALSLVDLNRALRQIPNGTPMPLVGEAGQGTVTGAMEFRQGDGTESWSADLDLTNARFEVAGMTAPVLVRRGNFRLRGPQWNLRRLQASVHKIECAGEISWSPMAKRPFRFSLASDQVDAAELEDLFLPTLERPASLLQRALRFRNAALPVWLRARHAEGSVAIGTFAIGNEEFRKLRMHVYWDGAQVEIPELESSWEDAQFHGQLSVRLEPPAPAYRLRGQLENVPIFNGKLDVDLDAHATGIGAALLASAAAQGDFRGRNLELEDAAARTLAGAYDYQPDRTPRLRLRSVELTQNGESWVGQGVLQSDGRMQLDLVSGTRPLRVVFDLLAKK